MHSLTPDPSARVGWSSGATDGSDADLARPFGTLRNLDGAPPAFVGATPNGAARLRVADALRELNHLLLTADSEVDDFDSLARSLEAEAALLRSHSKREPDGWENLATAGILNVRAPLLRADPDPADPQLFRCRSTFDVADEGPAGMVHGGRLALVLDQCAGAACGLAGTMAVTGTLNIRYEEPAPLHIELTFFMRVERQEGRKLFVTGGVSYDDTLCIRAEAVMIEPR